MGVRIFAQSIFTEDHMTYSADGYAIINDGIRRLYDKVLAADTEVHVEFVPRSTFLTSHISMQAFNNTEIIRGIMRAEEEDFDVAFVRCGNDPAIQECREAVQIPVVGMTEAAMHYACQLGSRFAVLGVDEKSGPIVERNIRLFGLEDKAIAVRPVRCPVGRSWEPLLYDSIPWFQSTDHVLEKVVPEFEKVARAAIDDGAEVIVTGCALFSVFTLAGYNRVSGTQVPVVESTAVGIKTAEMMGSMYRSLGLSTSKHMTYHNDITPEQRTMLLAPFTD